MRKYFQFRKWEKGLFIAFVLLAGVSSALFPEPAFAIQDKPSSDRECAICHIMWMDEFKRKDVASLIPFDPLPVEKSGKQDVASTDRMCFSCHDGFVLDSRFLWKKDRQNHPVGMIPSDDVTIPTFEGKNIFPMNEEGKLYCGSCHTAHGVDWKEKKDTTIFMRTRLDESNSNFCADCHENRITGPKQGNHPIRKKLKELPASLLAAGSKFSDKDEVVCQSCHLAHGAEEEKMLALPNDDSSLCSSCHTEQEQVRNTKHDMTVVAPDSKNARGRQVTDSGPCSACHVPHKAEGPVLWARTIPFDKDLGSAYCLSCHEKKGIAREKSIGKNSHPVDVPLKKVGIIAKINAWISRVSNKAAPKDIVILPLFDKEGRRVKEGGNVTCLSCHDPHQWSPDHGQKADANIRETDGDGSNSFLRIANNKESALCTNCHQDQAPVAFSKHNLEVSAPDEKNKEGMIVSRSGVCSACHLPHNGTDENMWARTVAENAKGVQAKCNDCHEKGSVAGDSITGEYSHPIEVSLDKVSGGTRLPLFTKNGKRSKNGQIGCLTCHNPHQWDPSNAIAKSGTNAELNGDAGNSFLRAKASGNAALCVDCHEPENAVIGTDHDLSITAGNALNLKGQTVDQSGTCGQCHAAHDAALPQRLWVQKMGTGDSEVENLCTGCHSRGGSANAKVPLELSHPPRTLSANEGRMRQDDERRLKPPLFDRDGKAAEIGIVSCLTCHDAHQWSTNKREIVTGKNREGDVSNSFLRHSSTEFFVCSDCHGEESLYRYKFFHSPKSRPAVDLEEY